jgi:hypothetical protein
MRMQLWQGAVGVLGLERLKNIGVVHLFNDVPAFWNTAALLAR